jgi:predicted enzyme related to lactoylglutathione lyase
MAIARYKDLCIDASASETLGRFWAKALGLQFSPDDDGGGYLSGDDPTKRVWMNVVPEEKSVKHRVHIDVHAASVDELVELGATVLDAAEDHPDRHWTVMADPEGGEFCAFVREPDKLPDYRMYELVIDAADHRAIAKWWGDVFGATSGTEDEHGFSWIEDVPGLPFEGWSFVPVPEPKTVKNRIHWDVLVDSIDDLTAAGATVLRAKDDEIGWAIMADPEGNEFCAFTPKE